MGQTVALTQNPDMSAQEKLSTYFVPTWVTTLNMAGEKNTTNAQSHADQGILTTVKGDMWHQPLNHKEQLRKDLETVPKSRKMSKWPMTTVVSQSGRANVGKI